jgi:uncharacterized protein (TIGR01568 family)
VWECVLSVYYGGWVKQNRKAELEELFQYYLDLNPAVHHDVIEQVIKDIREQVLTEVTI